MNAFNDTGVLLIKMKWQLVENSHKRTIFFRLFFFFFIGKHHFRPDIQLLSAKVSHRTPISEMTFKHMWH